MGDASTNGQQCLKGISKSCYNARQATSAFFCVQIAFPVQYCPGSGQDKVNICCSWEQGGQHPEVDLYHLTPLLGLFHVGTVWQREHLGRVVSVDSFTFPVPSATGIVAVIVSSKYLPQPVLFISCASQFSSPATSRGRK